MYLLRIAFRNLFRRRKRTFIIAGMLVVAVFFFLVVDSFMLAMMNVSFSNMIDFESPHIEIGREEFFEEDELSLDDTFALSGELESAVKEVDGFEAATPVVDFAGNMMTGREEYPVRVRAIEPESFKDVFRNHEFIIDGEFIEEGDNGVVIGNELAELLRLEVGDFFTLLFQDQRGSFNTIEGEVKGITLVPHPEMNLGTVFVSRNEALAPLGIGEEQVTQHMLRLEDRDLAEEGATQLEEKLGGIMNNNVQPRSYREASQLLASMEAWGYIETYFILALILLVGSIGVVNVIILSALERIEEIGMMKALGLKEKEIVKVFMLEAGGIGVIGATIGSALGVIGIALFRHFGFDIGATFGGMDEALGLPLAGRIYGVWNPSSFVLIFVFIVLLSLVASIFPSYWAARKDPVKAIFHR